MTAKKVSELDALVIPAAEDLLLIIDDPSVDPISKKITFSNLTRSITSNTFVALSTLNVGNTSSNVSMTPSSIAVGGSSINASITSTAIRIGNGTVNTVISSNSITIAGGGLLGQVYGDGFDTELTIKSPPGVGDSGYVALASTNEKNYVEVSNIGIKLGVEFGTAGFEEWTFDIAGDLTIPGSIVSNNSITVTSEVGETSSGVFLDGANNVILFATNNAIIRSDNDGTFKDLTFFANGNLEAPGTISAPNINATNHFRLPVYATDEARDAAITSPQPGMMIFVSGGEGAGLQVRGATQWNPVGGLTGV